MPIQILRNPFSVDIKTAIGFRSSCSCSCTVEVLQVLQLASALAAARTVNVCPAVRKHWIISAP